MSDRLIEKQVVYDGKKVRLELHHLEDEETGRRHKREVVRAPGRGRASCRSSTPSTSS